jgi:hypothetical protein
MAADPTEIELGHLGDIIFGPELKKQLKTSGIDTTRAIYELSSPTTQCGVITGIRNPNGTPCYICGMNINSADVKNVGKKLINQGLTAECEHILSIAQAIIFLGLYWAKAPAGHLFVQDPDILKLEYAWAHRTCNQIKSDMSLIRFDTTSTTYQPNIDNIQGLLQNIFKNKRADSEQFNLELHRVFGHGQAGLRNFLSQRIVYVSLKIQAITDYLNSFGAPQLLTLVGAAKVLEGPLAPEARTLLNTNESEKYNTGGFKMITNVAGLIDMVDTLQKETIKLLPPPLQADFLSFSSTVIGDYRAFIYFIYNIPPELNQYTKSYLKILLLRKYSQYLQASGRRQYTTVSKTADFLTKTSGISETTMAELNEYASTQGIVLGGKRIKRVRKQLTKKKKYKKTRKNRRH